MARKNKSGSVYKRDSDPEHTDRYRISMDGNYLFNLKLPLYKKIWLLFDALIFGLIYIIVGLIFSWILNSFVLESLDKSLSRGVVGLQVIGESLLNVFV